MDFTQIFPYIKDFPLLITFVGALWFAYHYMGKPLLEKLDGTNQRLDNLTEGLAQHKVSTGDQLHNVDKRLTVIEERLAHLQTT
jgi:hypothetical protein